ncbi:MAG: hypothetical protein LUB59_07855 [Candidatus Gastranaerophilales bacterium]|nr:hypothetical protein [Candidatus Gastranaerophilales bacterium]
MNTISSFNTKPMFNGKIFKKKNNRGESAAEAGQSEKAKDPWLDGFLAGATIGTVIVSAGLNINNKVETKSMMNDMAQEYKENDTKSIKIEDINEDDIPEFIIEKTDGAQFIYDFKKNSIGIKIDDEVIKKIR